MEKQMLTEQLARADEAKKFHEMGKVDAIGTSQKN